MNSSYSPTDSELEILSILYQFGPQTVRFVNDEINKTREIGYTTTLKTMQLMLDKGVLNRSVNERSHIYQPAVTESHTQNIVIKEMVERIFRGSASNLVINILKSNETSPEELEKIRQLLDQIQTTKK
ncbi:MAG: BlaI/MecI/CopY family transcriptional regulator [Saprospiraceae bacterium]|nr:BlaI/MecI/CopY family transcriptional regulator [Saprospiraceae bacterium]